VPLCYQDYDILLRCILEMHELAASGSLLSSLPEILSRLVPCDDLTIFNAHADAVALIGASLGCRLSIAWQSAHGMSYLIAFRGPSVQEFNERDRVALSLVRPHLEQACRTADRVSAARLQASERPHDSGLTPREIEIASWLSQGKANPEIAAILRIGQRTVEKHVEHILVKLGVENRTTAALLIRDGRA
jgi:DNA-binding CsgD family transcriptional regulator